MNVSPLRYPGGKTRACKILHEIFIEHFNTSEINTIISPFFGGGSFEFYLQNKYNYSIISNDLFTPLYNFWMACKNENELLCNELYSVHNVSKEFFNECKNSINLPHNYFIVNRCSFSGSTCSGGFSKESSKTRFTKSSIDRIKNLQLNSFEIFNEDFSIFLNTNFTEKTFLFVDPPYYLEKKSKLYGTKGDLHTNFDHQKLHEILKTKKKWMLTYNNCDYIRNLYKDYKIIEVSWSYSMNKSKESSEIIIIG
jgi:DNA adenine methylase